MNSNRIKYASTPTYGMQKRGFAKKYAAAQPAPTPDFTQQPAVDAGAPVAPYPAQNPFIAPPNAFPPVASQQGPVFPYDPGVASQGDGMPGYVPNQAGPNFQSYPQPIGNTAPAVNPVGYSTRAQGYVPPAYPQGGNAGPAAAYPQGNNAVPPNVVRGDAMGGAPMGGAGMPGSAPTFGAGNGYASEPYPGGMSAPGYGGASYPPSMQPPMMNASGGGNGFFSNSYPNYPGGSPAMPTPKPPFDMDKWLKILLYGVLPALFIPCVFVTHSYDFLRYTFIILAVVTLSVLWYRQSFSSGLRTTLSVLYLALCIVTIAFLVGSNNDVTQTSSTQGSGGSAQVTAAAAGDSETPTPEPEVTPTPEVDADKDEAEERLTEFMQNWQDNNYEMMTTLVQPSWSAAQDSAESALFTLICNRTPEDFTIESISGTAGDSSRTITMSSDINKNNGDDPTRYRFMILLVEEDGEWYVDPESLATNDTVDEDDESTDDSTSQTLPPRTTVTPIPAADTKLYYNADGGKYYHVDPNCSAINSKYLPLTSYFLYSELDDDPYRSLLPCLKCGAPTESLADAEADATATPMP
jgi:hypothetical protein